MTRPMRRSLLAIVAILTVVADTQAGDGGLFGRRRTAYRVAQPTAATRPFRPMTGTMYPTPYMTVGGTGTTGASGYSPLGQYGDTAMAMYGPFGSLRATAAPMTIVSRGYDGTPRVETATSFSYPFLPAASPVVYPTRGSVRGTFDFQSTPPWWDTGHGWVDQN